jgi:hypothetical protein
VEQLRAAEARARAAHVGLWAATTPSASGTAPRRDGSCPDTNPVKGNHGDKGCIFHVRGNEHYAATRAERCYATPADASADGCRAARR